MKKILGITILVFFFQFCRNSIANKKSKILYNSDMDSLQSAAFMDSLNSRISCEDDETDDIEIHKIKDSIDLMYDQIFIRLDSSKVENNLKEYVIGFKEALLKSKQQYLITFDLNQSILFYSYGNSTANSFQAKCYKRLLLKEQLLFLKAIFINSFDNYNFSSNSSIKLK